MIIKTPDQFADYRRAGEIATEILKIVKSSVEPGIYPADLEEIAQTQCHLNQVTPSFAPVENENGPYGYAMCISVNDTVLHGIPNRERALKEGDVVKLDFGIIYKGYHTDQCVTVGVKTLSKKNRKLIEATKASVQSALEFAIEGNTTGDLGSVMHRSAKQHGYDVLKQYIGHGIGLSLHDNPPIPAYGSPGRGARLKEGMVICVEAQLVPGSDQVYTTEDSWTIKTIDGRNSAMFEYMVVVGRNKPEILTPTLDWDIIQ